MAPGSLKKFASGSAVEGMMMGFEAELIVPDMHGEEIEPEPDYSHDQKTDSIEDIVEFFENNSSMSRRTAQQLEERLYGDWDEYRRELIRDLMNDEGEDLIRKLAQEQDYTDEEVEDMIAGEGRDYQGFQSDAQDQISERVENSITWSEFADWADVEMMSDVANKFDIEWPYYTDPASGKWSGVSGFKKGLEKTVGAEVVFSPNYHGAPRHTDTWQLETDDTVNDDPENGIEGMEVISPPMPIEAGIQALLQVLAYARRQGCKTDSSTGLHINISLASQTLADLDYVKLILFMGDQHVLERFDRQASEYCVSAFKMLGDHMKANPKFRAEGAMATMRKGLLDLATRELANMQPGKYVSAHLKRNYVEFRSPGGDYLEARNESTIIETVWRFVKAMAIASNPRSRRKEYAHKLYKFVRPTDPGQAAGMSAFSRYLSGEITAPQAQEILQTQRDERLSWERTFAPHVQDRGFPPVV